MEDPRLIFEEVTDPVQIERSRRQAEQHRRNSDWLADHWPDLLPGALGNYVAVAGQQAFVADTPDEAWAQATTAHPDDKGAFVQYVMPHKGPRIYDHRG